MPPNDPNESIREMALEIFELTKLSWIVRNLSKDKSDYDLGELEFLALDQLIHRAPLTVGDIQRRIGILPAQMSRVVRSLENKYDKPLIQCAINPDDKRKIDVNVTPAGRNAHKGYVNSRIGQTHDIIRALPENDRMQFIRILRDIRSTIDKGMQNK